MRNIILFASLFLILLSGCAEDTPSIDTEKLINESYRAWIAKNAPNATLIQDDIYIDYVIRNEHSLVQPTDTSWVEINYTGYDFSGKIFTTRSEPISRRIGKWNKMTHWVDKFTTTDMTYTTMNTAMIAGIKEMKLGDSARIYIPAKYSYAPSRNTGYDGELLESDGTHPIYFDVRLKKVIKDGFEYEYEKVVDYAITKWSKVKSDSIIYSAYMNKTLANSEGKFIGKDSIAQILISEYFLDGFIITTTDSLVAKEHGIYDRSSGSYFAMSIDVGNESVEHRMLLSRALLQLRKGEEADIVTTSMWTVTGMIGSEDSTPQVDYFTPRLYKITVLEDEEDEEEESGVKEKIVITRSTR